ncbi:MAG: HD domain-containing protein, partial [Clostridiales bacterium]|nr:HD domain-containing protein [Clostridiales bacterium]
MTKYEFSAIENYMLSQMEDSLKDPVHDKYHVYRVFNAAMDIACHEDNVDMDVLIAACLLHDVGRKSQAENPNICHALKGSEMAYDYLLATGWAEEKARHVRACVSSHRYRDNNSPESIEAKILFDADKIDVVGAIGIARTFIYGGQVGEPIYIFDENGEIVVDGGGAEVSSFFQEYNFKHKNISRTFYTKRAKEIG